MIWSILSSAKFIFDTFYLGRNASPALSRWGIVARRLASEASHGFYFSIAKCVAQASQLAIFILAARLLLPAQFGLFAVTSGVVVLLSKMGEAGWREFVLSSRNSEAVEQAPTAALLSSSLAACLCAGGSTIAFFLSGYDDVAWMLALFAIWLVPTCITAVQSGMMIRRERIPALASVQIASEIVCLTTSVATLFAGHGIFSLIYGRLAYQACSLLLLVLSTRWLPPLRLQATIAKELWAFSRQILAVRLISFFRSYAATLSAGLFLGPANAGFFRAAERIVLSFSEVLAETSQTMAWKSFKPSLMLARETDADEVRMRLARKASFFHPLQLAVAAPIFVGLALIADDLFVLVLGEPWRPAAAAASVISIRQLLIMPCFLTEPLMAMAGEIKRVTPISAITASLSVLLVVVMAPFGIVAVAYGQLLAAAISLMFAIRLQSRYAKVDFRDVVRRSASLVPALAAMVGVVMAVEAAATNAGLSPWIIFLLQPLSGAAAYAAVLAGVQAVVPRGGRMYAPVVAP